MELKLYHLHPAAVHFPIALLTLGAAAAGLRLRKDSPVWLAKAESWLLWLGTFAAWTTLGLGLLAEKTAPHVAMAWEVLADHETLAWWTCAAFSVLSSLRVFVVKTGRDGVQGRWFQIALWATGLALLVATAMHGAELVYGFGMGVGAP
ncbi:MAG TPA: hypothetical protein DCZ01_12275 [Elusimicrobia bacterium]|nr:MAG: hypothetical protein A2X37_07000 [Elusimicrobia bacterium GWA2_66_18]OGR74629.1 MAG: hypothetical protein A2X40_01445 [Elusimicrobia bacterium GWC2_65_9]HAZ09267.1 hypothetical protein [Elusimicrobiota bacterium]